MGLNIDSTLGDLVTEAEGDEAMIIKIREIAIGHSINDTVTIGECCQHVAFITRPSLILYMNDRTKGATDGN